MDTKWKPSWPHDDHLTGQEASGAPSSSVLLYTMLPGLLQRRIPRLRSLRRNNTEPGFVASTPNSACHSRMSSCSTATENIHSTPPPAYRSGSSSATTSDDETSTFYPTPPAASTYLPINSMPSRPASSEGMPLPTSYPEEARSGVQWRYAEAGFSMLTLASHEASSPLPGSNLIRQQYIAGVSCMLRGLPTDLSAEEELSLREALPGSLKPVPNTQLSPSSSTPPATTSTPKASLLHRLIASLTLSLFLLFSYLLPYIQHLLRSAYVFDRRHKLTDRALAYGMTSADALGRQALVVVADVCAMQDGRVGEVLREAAVHVVRAVGGGVYDGVGEGMVKVGLRGGWSGEGGFVGGGGGKGQGHGKAPWVLQWQQR